MRYFTLCLAVTFVGCNSQSESAEETDVPVVQELPKIQLAIVDAPELGPELKRLWQTTMSGELTFTDLTAEEFAANEFSAIDDADVVVYPCRFKLDLLVANKLGVINEHLLESEEFNERALLRPYRDSAVKFDDQRLVVSLGEPMPAIFFRKDIFEEYELKIPGTWAEYHQVAADIARLRSSLENDELKSVLRTVEAADEGGLAKNLAFRAAARLLSRGRYSTFFNVRSMEPLLNSPPFVRALTEMSSARESIEFVSAEEAYKSIVAGRATMALTWPTAAWSPNANATEFVEPNPIDVISLPQSAHRYDYGRQRWVERERATVLMQGFNGHLASVTEESDHQTTARMFVLWLAGKEISTRLRGFKSYLNATRLSHLGNLAGWLGDDLPHDTQTKYVDIVRDYAKTQLRLSWISIPDSERYVQVLNEAVQAVMGGDSSPETALAEAASRWQKLNEQFTVERQRRYFRGGLGL